MRAANPIRTTAMRESCICPLTPFHIVLFISPFLGHASAWQMAPCMMDHSQLRKGEESRRQGVLLL